MLEIENVNRKKGPQMFKKGRHGKAQQSIFKLKFLCIQVSFGNCEAKEILHKKNAILTRKPQIHVRILIYRWRPNDYSYKGSKIPSGLRCLGRRR